MHSEEQISIWFFIGLLLLAYGILILGAGIYDWSSHAASKVVLSNLHSAVWWGALLLLLGIVYCVHFFPRRKNSNS
ncbi:MAG TPA: hypothetical protein VFF39_16845 [Verrucomicrobiae bacterium]|jgi:uncharacterized membrane protein HdeD (DUF308 family)|nr:hypothetical protein [Verrucomicrobiae bacterium]